MHLVQAALAFAITMLFLSMIVTTIVESLHRIFGIREKGLSIMLGELFDEALWPRVKQLSKTVSKDDARKAFVDEVSRNRVGKKENVTRPTQIARPDRLTALSTMQFIQRMADTETGKSLYQQAQMRGKDALNTAVRDVARRFEELGSDASEYFGARSRLVSVVISILLVFTINVDALRLFKTYMSNDALRQSVIAQSESLQNTFQERAVAEETLLQLRSGDVSQQENLEALKASNERILEQLESIDKRALPIGWEYFPYCYQQSSLGLCEGDKLAAGAVLLWALGVLLAGVLVGLGGPFWFDTIRSLTMVLNLARTGSDGQKARDREAAATSTGIKPSDVSDAFVTAASLNSAGPRRRRALLNKDGQVNTTSTGRAS